MPEVSQYIPLYSEAGEYLRTIADDDAYQLIQAGRATVVRGRSKSTRRVYLTASVEHRLVGQSKDQAIRSYRGIAKYTYLEHFEVAPACHMLKRYRPRVGDFVRWPAVS